jgi:putative transposase
MQYPQNVKILSDTEIKFPGNLGVVNAKIHRDLVGNLRTVTVSKMPDGRYYASLLMDDGIENPAAKEEGRAIGIDLGLLDFVVTSDGSKYQNPRHLKKHERNLRRKQCKLSRKKDKNEGLRILTLGTSVTAPGGNVRPKQYGRKSTAVAAVALEGRSPLHTGTPVEGG